MTWAAIAGALALGFAGVRRWQTGWGATSAEAARSLPGDDIVGAPQYAATNAVTIAAPPPAVWPWLVQMGAYGRAGWYSFDRLDNGGVPSARHIVPELQDLRVGDVMATDRRGGGFRVEAIDPRRSLVLGIRAPQAVTSAVFVLDPATEDRTRLLVRVRVWADASVRGLGYRLLMEVGHVVMIRRTLLGIKARAEQAQSLATFFS